jgi:hypothetical protein
MECSRRTAPWGASSGLPVVLGGLLLCLAGAVAGVAYLPTHDGPQHVFTLHAAHYAEVPGTGWEHWLEPNVPLTNHGFAVVFTPFDAWLPWPLALRAALAVMVVAWGLGIFCFVRAVRPERAWLGVGLAASALCWPLYMGFFSFHAASALGFFVLALAFGQTRWRPMDRGLLAVLLLAVALMHVAAAIVTGGIVVLLAILRAAPGARLRETGVALAMGLPAACVALALAGAGLDQLAEFNEGADAVAQQEEAPWWTLGRCFLGGPAWRAWPLTLLALAAPGFALRRGPTSLSPEDRTLVAGGVLLMAGAAWLPLHIVAWDFFSVRFLPLAVVVLVAALPFERLAAWPRQIAVLVLAGFAFAATGWAFDYNRTLHGRAADALAGLDAGVARDGMRLPIVLDPYLELPSDPLESPMPYSVPLLNLGQLYAAAQGGLVPYTFMFNPWLHPVLFQGEWHQAVDRRYAIDLASANADEAPGLRQAMLIYLAGRGTAYQDVILWGIREDVDRLEALGFRSDWRQGGAAIAHFEGCPFTLEFPPGSEVPTDAIIEIGWLPAWHTTHRYSAAKALPTADGGRALPLRQTCQGLWVRFDPPTRACEGADAEGRLLVPSTGATPRVTCRLQERETRSVSRDDAEALVAKRPRRS